MSRRRLAVVLAATALAVVVPLAASRSQPAETATALAPPTTPFPTTPCTGCGPTGSGPNAGTRAFAYPEHFCTNDPTSPGFGQFPIDSGVYALVYGLGKNAGGGPATFFAAVDGLPVRQLSTLDPGQTDRVFPLVVIPTNTQISLTVWATFSGKPGGTRVVFGNGSTFRQDTLVCDCPKLVASPPVGEVPTTPAIELGSVPTGSVPSESPPVKTVPPGGIFPPTR
jgi:hypothetical protein